MTAHTRSRNTSGRALAARGFTSALATGMVAALLSASVATAGAAPVRAGDEVSPWPPARTKGAPPADLAAAARFASGLTNPRHLGFGPDGLLYVAEAGVGGNRPATETPGCPLVDNLFSQAGPYKPGFTGRVSRVLADGTRETVARGLPSVTDNFGDALGPSDIAWIDGKMYVAIEGGGCSRGLPEDPAGIVRIRRDGSYSYVADISAFIRANPVANEPACGPEGDCEPDGVPHAMLAVGRQLYVVETNHNSVLRVNPRTGAIKRIYDLSVQDPAPIMLIRRGSRFYLGGFDGLVQTFSRRLGPVRTLDDGYSPIVDMGFARGRLHLLETFASETPFTPETGRVVRRGKNGGRTVIASGLNFPIGMALSRGHGYGRALYVSTLSYGQGPVEGLGRVVRIELDPNRG